MHLASPSIKVYHKQNEYAFQLCVTDRFLEQKEGGGNDEQRCRSRGFHRVTRKELGGKRQGSKSLMCSCPYIDQHMQRKKQAEGTAKLRAAERNRDWHARSLEEEGENKWGLRFSWSVLQEFDYCLQ